MDDCWFCGDNRGDDTPPGGWLTTYGGWRAGHVPGGLGPGRHRRHRDRRAPRVAGRAARRRTAMAFTQLLGRTQEAICEVTGADRAYVWATMDRTPPARLGGAVVRADALARSALPRRGPHLRRGSPDEGNAASAAAALRERLSAALARASARCSGRRRR